MNVIRHDYITANGDVEVTLGTLGISDERRMNFIAREIWLPQVSAKGDKIERAGVKETTETRRAASEILLHEDTCSHGPAGRLIITSYSGPFIDRPQAGGYNIREIALVRPSSFVISGENHLPLSHGCGEQFFLGRFVAIKFTAAATFVQNHDAIAHPNQFGQLA